MSYKNYIKTFLRKTFGINIQRVPKSSPFDQKQSAGSNILIEFLGASGVGKTTLCKYYLNQFKVRFEK